MEGKEIKRRLILVVVLVMASICFANSPGDDSDNVTSRVNVTNAIPTIDEVTLPVIDLNPGLIKEINCTVHAFDYNGWNDITKVNATLWDNATVNMGDPDDNSTHYFNSNCTGNTGGSEGLYNRTFYCSFNLTYYANSGTNWVCNASVIDDYNYTDFNYNTTTINPLYALNVTPQIEFGQAVLGDTVANKTANITNFGNQDINLSVDGYGASDGDGLAMTCEQNSISLNATGPHNLRFSNNSLIPWGSMQNLTDNLQNVTGLSIPKVTDATKDTPGAWYSTYWSLYIPADENPFGVCTGTVVFTAWNA